MLRPSPRVVAYHLRFGVLCAALAALGWWGRLTVLPIGLVIVAVVQLVWWLRGVVGRVELLADAVRIRRLLGVSTVGAEDVLRFEARTTVFGRHVRLEHSTRRGTRSMRLPAPTAPRLVREDRFDAQVAAIQAWWHSRHGAGVAVSGHGRARRWVYPVVVLALVVAAVLPDRPWGWLSGAEATEIPDVCEVLRSTVDQAVESVAVKPVGAASDRPVSGCRFAVDHDRILIVLMTLYSRSGVHSATSIASANVRIGDADDTGWSSRSLVPVPGADTLGDASRGAYLDPFAVAKMGLGARGPNMFNQRGVPIGAVVVARRANAVVEAFLVPESDQRGPQGAPLQESDTATLITVVRVALTSVALH